MEADERFVFTLDGQLQTDRRLPRDQAGERAAAARARRGGSARDRAVAGADGRVPRLRGDDLAEPRGQGLERAREFGGEMRVGYLPDMFGHIAQMPQILRAHGLDNAVVWRGVPAAVEETRVRVARRRRLVGARRVPAGRLRQRRVPPDRAGQPRRRCRRADRGDAAVLRRRPGARDVRHGPPGAAPGARRRGRARERGERSRADRAHDARRSADERLCSRARRGRARCARALARTS